MQPEKKDIPYNSCAVGMFLSIEDGHCRHFPVAKYNLRLCPHMFQYSIYCRYGGIHRAVICGSVYFIWVHIICQTYHSSTRGREREPLSTKLSMSPFIDEIWLNGTSPVCPNPACGRAVPSRVSLAAKADTKDISLKYYVSFINLSISQLE